MTVTALEIKTCSPFAQGTAFGDNHFFLALVANKIISRDNYNLFHQRAFFIRL